MYAEALEVILRGMTCTELSFEGTYYRYDDVPMELAPFQRPHPPLWYGIGRPEAVPWAASNRVNVVGNLGGPGMRAHHRPLPRRMGGAGQSGRTTCR